ncbi:MAG TPA: hypothetical protein VF892_14230 [Pseudonocardiaceae bacterium]
MDTSDRSRRAVWWAISGCAAAVLLAGCTTSGTTAASPPPASTTAGSTAMPGQSTPAAGDPTPTPTAANALQITTLHNGQTITLPATIGFQIAGAVINAAAGYHVRVQADSHTLDLPINSTTGTVQLPIDKFLAGKRDLTFILLGPNTPASVVVIHNLMIIGPK